MLRQIHSGKVRVEVISVVSFQQSGGFSFDSVPAALKIVTEFILRKFYILILLQSCNKSLSIEVNPE